MYLCRATSQALASRLSRPPPAASRLKQRGTRRPSRSSTEGLVEVNGTVRGGEGDARGGMGRDREGDGDAPPPLTAEAGGRAKVEGRGLHAMAGDGARLRLPPCAGREEPEGCLVSPAGNGLPSNGCRVPPRSPSPRRAGSRSAGRLVLGSSGCQWGRAPPPLPISSMEAARWRAGVTALLERGDRPRLHCHPSKKKKKNRREGKAGGQSSAFLSSGDSVNQPGVRGHGFWRIRNCVTSSKKKSS